MKVVISAGGSGGHIYPALAIINKIKEHDKNSEFLYIGTKNRMEKDIVPSMNIPYYGIDVYGLKRKISLDNFKSIYKYLYSIKLCKKKIKEFNPDIVIGAGGYVCAPVITAAKKCGYKTLVHEQNSTLGLTNRMLLKYTDTLCTSFENIKINGVNVVYTGNPQSEHAKNIKPLTKKELKIDDNKKIVVIVMGSLGSKTVNDVLIKSINDFKEDYNVILITGKSHYEEFNNIKKNKNVIIKPYIENLPALFKISDLVVTRAGATTICELASTRTPALFIPSPYVTENHQYKNAMSLVNESAGFILEEKDLNSKNLINKIDSLLNDEKRLKEVKKNLEKFDIEDSSERIFNEIKKLVD